MSGGRRALVALAGALLLGGLAARWGGGAGGLVEVARRHLGRAAGGARNPEPAPIPANRFTDVTSDATASSGDPADPEAAAGAAPGASRILTPAPAARERPAERARGGAAARAAGEAGEPTEAVPESTSRALAVASPPVAEMTITLTLYLVDEAGEPFEGGSPLVTVVADGVAGAPPRAVQVEPALVDGAVLVPLGREWAGPVRVAVTLRHVDLPEDETAEHHELIRSMARIQQLSAVAAPVDLVLAPGANGPVALTLAFAGGLAVSVADARGAPVTGAVVAVSGANDDNAGGYARTADARGTLRLPPWLAPPGALSISAEDPERRRSLARIVQVDPFGSEVTLRLPDTDTGRVDVRFTDTGGRPLVTDAAVALVPEDPVPTRRRGRRFALRLARVDAASTLSLEAPEGRYTLSAAIGDGVVEDAALVVARGAAAPTPVVAGPPGELLLRLSRGEAGPLAPPLAVHRLPREATGWELHRRVSAGPDEGILLSGAGAVWLDVRPWGGRATSLDALLRPGVREERLIDLSTAPAAPTVEMERLEPPPDLARGAIPGEEEDDLSDLLVDDLDQTAGGIDAVVLGPAGIPVAGIVAARSASGAVVGSKWRTGLSGRVTLALPPGVYAVTARPEMGGVEGAPVTVEVRADALTRVALRTGAPERGAFVEGTVANALLWRTATLSVRVFRADGAEGGPEHAGEVDGDGRYALGPLTPGVAYTLRLEATSAYQWWKPLRASDTAPTPLTLEPGERRALDLAAPAPARVAVLGSDLWCLHVFDAATEEEIGFVRAHESMLSEARLALETIGARRLLLAAGFRGDGDLAHTALAEVAPAAGEEIAVAVTPRRGAGTLAWARAPRDAWIRGLGVLVEMGAGGPRRVDGLPAGAYEVRKGGRALAAFTLADGQIVDVGALLP